MVSCCLMLDAATEAFTEAFYQFLLSKSLYEVFLWENQNIPSRLFHKTFFGIVLISGSLGR